MYYNEFNSTKKGKSYKSYREAGKVKHRTICNLSKFFKFHILQIKRLKSIRKVEVLLNEVVIKTNISKSDKEQKEILELFKTKTDVASKK